MSDQLFEFRVTGHEPKPWGVGKGEWIWRAAIAPVARAAREAAGYPSPLLTDEGEPRLIAISIVFRMSPPKFLNADLDNLAKPVLDTMFRAKHVQAPTDAGDVSGMLFGFDDSRVVKLVLEKSRVESVVEAGIDVVVSTFAQAEFQVVRGNPQ